MDYILTSSPVLYVTQSLWRDEAFSVLLSAHTPIEIVQLTAGDFTPPLYYILLHLWMYVFGTSEIAVRMLSFIFFLGVMYLIFLIARSIGRTRDRMFPIGTVLITAVNPMLVYFAFEARTYMLTTFFTVASSYFFIKQKWKCYVAVSVLGLYSHPYVVFLLLAHGVYALLQKDKKHIRSTVTSALLIGLLYAPWLFAIYFQIHRAGYMWFYAVDRNLVEAVLGNLYLGFEGTPHWFWVWSKRVSILILAATITAVFSKNIKKKYLILVVSWFYIPLLLVVGFSFIKTIYVMRYMMFIVPAELLIISIAIFSVSRKWVRVGLFTVVFGATSWFNFWYAPYNTKVDYRSTFSEISQTFQEGDIILSSTSLPFFESAYYARDEDDVYLYNPDKEHLPAYVGAVLIPEEKWMYTIPIDKTSFMINEDGSYEKITR